MAWMTQVPVPPCMFTTHFVDVTCMVEDRLLRSFVMSVATFSAPLLLVSGVVCAGMSAGVVSVGAVVVVSVVIDEAPPGAHAPLWFCIACHPFGHGEPPESHIEYPDVFCASICEQGGPRYAVVVVESGVEVGVGVVTIFCVPQPTTATAPLTAAIA